MPSRSCRSIGFTGVLYVPYDYIGTPGYLTVDHIKAMAAAGWEVGSHSLSHPVNFLALEPAALRSEIVTSRKQLTSLLELPILTFAYPFGENSNAAVDYVHFAGYIAGMGATGFTADQGIGNLFVLQRCEIKGSEDAKTMTRFLPWHGDPAFLPTDTPTPTPRPYPHATPNVHAVSHKATSGLSNPLVSFRLEHSARTARARVNWMPCGSERCRSTIASRPSWRRGNFDHRALQGNSAEARARAAD